MSLPSLSPKDSQSLAERLLAGLESGDMNDVELIGDDGEAIPACRFVLGCASPVMKRMFFGEFSEASSKQVTMNGWDSHVLRSVVKYCFSNTVQDFFFSHPDSGDTTEHAMTLENAARHTIALSQFANAYDVAGLEEKLADQALLAMQSFPHLACLFFEMTDKLTTNALYSKAWHVIQTRPESALRTTHCGGIEWISPTKLREIFANREEFKTTDLFLFQLLESYRMITGCDLEFVKEMADTLNLAHIEPTDLKDHVMKSDLVDPVKVNEAFMEQALRASREGLVFSCSHNHRDSSSLLTERQRLSPWSRARSRPWRSEASRERSPIHLHRAASLRSVEDISFPRARSKRRRAAAIRAEHLIAREQIWRSRPHGENGADNNDVEILELPEPHDHTERDT